MLTFHRLHTAQRNPKINRKPKAKGKQSGGKGQKRENRRTKLFQQEKHHTGDGHGAVSAGASLLGGRSRAFRNKTRNKNTGNRLSTKAKTNQIRGRCSSLKLLRAQALPSISGEHNSQDQTVVVVVLLHVVVKH